MDMDSEKYILENFEQMALELYDTTGEIPTALLDSIIEHRGIKISEYKNKKKARKMWRRLIVISLIAPELYEDISDSIEHEAKNLILDDNDIPDIVA